MKATVTFTFTHELDELPRSCSECPFGDVCASVAPFRLTKGGGVEWTKAAMTRRHKMCPMKVEG